jgi:thiosulfate/3-mercaptopyruvate sulfurtransferase
LEPWEKVLVDGDQFLKTVHGQISCTTCHQGEQSPDKESAHTGLIAEPSEYAQDYCASCHTELVSVSENSLHRTLDGYWTVLEERGVPENHPAAQEMFGNHCASCHASCGDCHVSQPTSVGGGLLDGHVFQETPSMTRNCTACHGSRVGNEFLGKHEDLKADVHFRQGRMQCVDCHTSHEMHGQPSNCQECHIGPENAAVAPPDHRYAGIQSPSCESCHASVAAGNDGILMHEQHGSKLSCQVCHSISYTSCDGCHVSISAESGNPVFATEGSYLGFFIGKNPNPSYSRPYEYVPVRHVPISETSFQYYGEGLISDFYGRPTWTYATPHNIQRVTPQAEYCGACHGNPDIFLTADKVAEDELEANWMLIIDEVPGPLGP